jgi:hypothetical protein
MMHRLRGEGRKGGETYRELGARGLRDREESRSQSGGDWCGAECYDVMTIVIVVTHR